MKKILFYRFLSSIVLVSLTFFFVLKNDFYFIFFLFFSFLVSIKEWIDLNYKKNLFFLGVIFIFFSFVTAYLLRINDNGMYLFFFVIIICASSDIGGFVFGQIFKGPKLTKISPNKTYSGVLGAYILSFCSIYFYIKNYPIFLNNNFLVNYKLLIIIFLISTISQLGDLIVSYFKRRSKIKDTGILIPGHGGVLDRIDGILFAIPFFYLIILFDFYK